MGCKCGSQVILCNLPVRFDTYRGCSHGCRYCFAQKKNDISHIERDESVEGLRSFIEGKRGQETSWCDWNIPIHWGGMSDPFQPIEKKVRASYECLKLLAETKYPFVVSTKGRLVADPEYLDLLAQCNCVVQISMVCSKYDRMEAGCPSYEERLGILATVSPRVKRTIVRIQPYMPEVFRDVLDNIPRVAAAGAHGIVVEGMKFFRGKPGMVKIGGDFCYPKDRLKSDFEEIRAQAHRNGLKFYSGENRLRAMGDDMTCCGIEGLEGFRPNEYNLCMIMNGKKPEPTEQMKKIGTGGPSKPSIRAPAAGAGLRNRASTGVCKRSSPRKRTTTRGYSGLTSERDLTPVQVVDGLLMKRDDLYAPFGAGEVNGGKLRQCVMLVDSIKDGYEGLVTYCSIHSPQGPITAAVARKNGMHCHIIYGGTSRENVAALPMPRLAMKYGAEIVLAARSGRHSILHARARELAAKYNSFIVQYGINIVGHGDTLLTAVAAQAENLPEEIEHLVMTCGSGITATGVMIGLKRYGKTVHNVHLVATAPDRRQFIHETLKKYGADREFQYHDLFHRKGFLYEKPATARWGGITLHPHYEAKAMQWFKASGIPPESALFWITGAEPWK